MPNVLITSMGGSGSLNLTDTIRLFDKKNDFRIIGTHCDPYELAKSDLKDLILVPKAVDEDAFIDAHVALIEKYNIDLLIANSDFEVTSFSKHLNRIKCGHLIPDKAQVEAVQDKYKLNRILDKHGCPAIMNVPITSRENIRDAVEAIQPCDKFWLRLRQESSSVAAAWFETADQAEKWIDLWSELRGFKYEEFIVAPFLPGRDFCVALMFNQGEFLLGKIYERLGYIYGGVAISGMGSSPNFSRTIDEREPVDTCIESIEKVCDEFGVKPHGYYQLDMKCDEKGVSYVTEINIGRFPMTSPQFDRVGQYNMLQLYIQMILEPEKELPKGVYDFDPGLYILRAIDMPYRFVTEQRLNDLKENAI